MSGKRVFLLLAALVALLSRGLAGDVTITARVPVQHMNAAGEIDGANMSVIGNHYAFGKQVAGQVCLVDPQGGFLVIDIAATSYQPPAANLVPAPTLVPAVVRASPPLIRTAQPTPISHGDPMVDKLNQALGFPLFNPDKSLWEEDAATVGQRLHWDADSITSYRKYDERAALKLHLLEDADESNPSPSPDPSVTTDAKGDSLLNCLGSHAYCRTLYTRHGKPDLVSLIFANNGDLVGTSSHAADTMTQDVVTPIISREAKYLEHTLTNLLGDFMESGFGASTVREPAKRWDWNGNSILLIHSKGRYVGIIICPTEFADMHGIRSDRDSNELRANLINNIKRLDNGDVTIENIPAVDQGPKGYCVPATWERNLRYMDIPSDMYFFATAAGTGLGGGTNDEAIREALGPYLQSYQTHVLVFGQIDQETVAKYVETGRPLMWTCFVWEDIEKQARKRRLLRVQNWDAYLAQEKADVAGIPHLTPLSEEAKQSLGHVRLIVGYNSKTGEIATSDSWAHAPVIWRAIEEIEAEDEGDTTVLQ